jgi:four helix bundle protein
MASFKGIEEINVWKIAVDLAVEIYSLTGDSKELKRDYGFKDQLQRAIVSIPSNIAEGFERETNAEFVRFLYIAKGSCGELRTQLLIAKEIGYIDDSAFRGLNDKCKQISSMVFNLIKVLK